MKRYITFVLVAMSLVGLVACSNDNGIAAPDGEAQVALRFESSSMTRADEVAGINDLNENLIKTIDCYFYPAKATEDTQAVWYQKFTFGTNGAGINSSATVTDILMPSGEMNAIFGQGTTGKIYAIANYAGGDALPTSGANTTVAKLKDMVVTTAWLDNGAYKAQASFVMDSEMVEITKSDNTISGEVPLFRTAAKVELTITDVEEVVSSTTTNADGTQTTTWYVPAILDASNNPTGANVTMYNARTIAGVGGIAQTYSEASSLKLENYGFSNSTVAGALYKQTYPFYTYPHTWETSEQEASLLLVVSWQATDKTSKDDEDFKLVGNAIPCYYEIPIGLADNTEILRNHIYQIGINVGTLGSFVKEDPVLLTPSYMVVDWGTGDISAKIKGQRYLVVDKNKVRVDNEDVCSVAYDSSHDVAAEIESIVFYDLTEDTAEEQTITSFTTSTSGNETTYRFTYDGRTYTFILSAVNGELSVTHVLQNNKDLDDFDYVPYTINVNIHHSDEDYADTFTTDVTFEQYPAMYITAYQNPDFTDAGGENNHKGYMFVNGYTGGDSGSYPSGYKTVNNALVQCLGSANGLTSTTNANPNSYLLTLSSFADNTYVIGDPRTQDVDETLRDATYTPNRESGERTIWASAPALDGTTRTLTYPYPTRATADTKNMIAPQIRIASSYSVLSANFVTQKEIARRRCASYQEAGYPAGRWRLPTKAEAEYMVKLSAEGLIPKLYSSGYRYWCAHGYFVPYNTAEGDHAAGDIVYTESDTNGGASVRCVYDVWYWGDERISNISTFTWGDMPR